MGSFIRISPVLLVLFLCGCGAGIKPLPGVETAFIEFRAAPDVNRGQILPIDIVYISYAKDLRSVVRYGPDRWFDTDFRRDWVQKESIALKSGQHLRVELNEEFHKRAKLIVIFADFIDVSDPSRQQVIIDYAGETVETIFASSNRLVPKNVALRYLE